MYRSLFLLISISSLVYFHGQNEGEFTQFKYPNGMVSSEGYLLDGRPEGFWKTYYTDGSIKSVGNRKNFELDSVWTFYDNLGEVTERIEYLNGKRNGITRRYKNGVITEKCEFRNDTLNGLCLQFEEGRLDKEIPFKDGKQEGKGYSFDKEERISAILYFKAGFLRSKEKINRIDKLGRKQGPWKEFYEDRSLKAEGTYVDDKKNGLFKSFNEKGELVSVEKYVNGILDSEAAETTVVDIRNEYYSNGVVKSSGSYKEGKKHGVHRDYDEEGNIIASRIYEYGKEVGSGIIGRSGRLEGPWEEKYDNGNIKEEGNYENGLRKGKWTFFYPDGKLSQKGSFRKGKPHGEWKWYYPDGSLRRVETYRNGREDGISIEYSEDGEVMSKGEYLDGLKEGKWIYRIGDHRIEGSYVQGDKEGKWTGVYDNGKNQFKGEFQRGFATGKHRFYYASGQLMQDGKYSSGRKDGEWRRFDEDGEMILRSSFQSGIERRIEGVKILPTYEELDID
ncbi:MAG: toxin-antitoxin system YwqK family antitoxin [Flavobacteriales bacterium]|nr:toxin-antitoxin system YwqK family antitoxin [Flavobacteriales bacterium]